MTSPQDHELTRLRRLDPVRHDAPPEPGSARYNAILEESMSGNDTITPPAARDGRATTSGIPQPRRWSRRAITWAGAAATTALVAAAAGVVALSPAGHDVPGSGGGEPQALSIVLAAAENTGRIDSLRISMRRVLAIGERKSVVAAINGKNAEGTITEDGITRKVVRVGGYEYSVDHTGKVTKRRLTAAENEDLPSFGRASEAVLRAALTGTAVTAVGTEQVRGVQATHYRVPLTAAPRAALRRLGTKTLGWFMLEFPDSVQSVDIWVADNLVRRVVVTTSAGTSTLEYYDFDTPITIKPPTAS